MDRDQRAFSYYIEVISFSFL